MATIGVIPARFWDSPAMRAADPDVVYVGPMPSSPTDYYATASLLGPIGRRHAFVYLLLGCDGSALYVGKARNPGNRFDKHRSKKEWWPEVAILLLLRVTGEDVFEADRLALHVEALCIRKFDPVYNIAGVVRRPAGIPRGEYA